MESSEHGFKPIGRRIERVAENLPQVHSSVFGHHRGVVRVGPVHKYISDEFDGGIVRHVEEILEPPDEAVDRVIPER
jgi:hypothetical protein